jgi:hypothetical protein
VELMAVSLDVQGTKFAVAIRFAVKENRLCVVNRKFLAPFDFAAQGK